MSPEDQNPVRVVRWVGQTAVVEVEGDIDLRSSPAFQEALTGVLNKNPDAVVVDLSGVPYMDSSGVASLVKVLSRVKKQDIPLRLAEMSERVRSIFEITHLDTVFDIRPSVDDAVEKE
ncbi:MAG: STAS domain-containing protein [Phycisphaerae bacterium]